MITPALREAMRQSSWALADELRPKPGETFTLRSKSRDGLTYEMIAHPDGGAVHNNEGCEGERFHGPWGCYHARRNGMTSVTKYEGGAVAVRTMTEEDVQVLKTTICRGASDAELGLFVATCKHTGLDPFMRQIHAVFRNTNVGTKSNPDWQPVMTIQIGIDGYRLVADRTGLTEGMDGPFWSPDGKDWYDFPDPAAQFAKVSIWRKGVPRAFTTVCRLDAYAQDNHMWKDMGPEQLAKCAEALALRRAFPAEMAGLPMATESDESEPEPPLTRAEVPEGSFRELDAPVPATAFSSMTATAMGREPSVDEPVPPQTQAPPAPDTNRVSTNEQPTGPIALLNLIEKEHGLGAKQAAIKVMTRLYGTAAVTKLDDDQKADYLRILAVRRSPDGCGEHELAYAADATPVCRICGDELQEPKDEQAQEAQQTAFA